METTIIKDANGINRYFQVSGTGTLLDPFASVLAPQELKAEFKSPADFQVEVLTSNTIQISSLQGIQITDSSQIEGVKIIHADASSRIYKNGVAGVTLTISSDIITITGIEPFVAGDVIQLGIEAQKKGFYSEANANGVHQINEPKIKHTNVMTLAESGLAVGTHYFVLWGFDMHSDHQMEVAIGSAGTMTFYDTLNEELPDDDETNYPDDVTNEIFGVASLTWGTFSGLLISDMPVKVLVKVVATDITWFDIFTRHLN